MEEVYDYMPLIGPDMTLAELLQTLFNTAIIFAAIVAVAFLIFSGFRYMSAGGDTGKTEEAQKGVGNALVGLVICLSAAIMVNFVLNLLGMQAPVLE